MAANLRRVFADRAQANLPTFVTFVTAGYPSLETTVPLMLAMEAGGADIIELGVPFTDPLADGIAIQESNIVALGQNVDYPMCLKFVKEARSQGLKAPVILMGYYNPLLAHGEQASVAAAREAGADGFIIVDCPPEEAIKFREVCTAEGLSYVPLIAPSTSNERIKFLATIADSFIYVVSKMGTTGVSASISSSLPGLLSRIRKLTSSSVSHSIPLAVGFGVSNASHFDEVGATADGVVIGSNLIETLKNAGPGPAGCQAVQRFCEEVCGGRAGRARKAQLAVNGVAEVGKKDSNRLKPAVGKVKGDTVAKAANTTPVAGLDPGMEKAGTTPPPRFGEFGGRYVPEALVGCLVELEEAHRTAMNDPEFWEEFEGHYGYMNRPSGLYFAARLTEYAGGAKIWLKREDLNHTGSHKINNAMGQILLAQRLGKTRIIAETGAGQHGVATATLCAKFGLECTVYMGAEDARRQALNVFRMKMLGAKVVAIATGNHTLKDAINEAMRDWVTNLSTTHYLVGSAIGPHPFPTIVRDFQSVIGNEIKKQLQERAGKLPDVVVACVGGGSNAIGTFYPFINDPSVRMVGVEAGGEGVGTARHSATLAKGTKGVLHGVHTYILQTPAGQIIDTHSISAGLDYPAVGPEHAFLKDSGRAEYIVAEDSEALRGFNLCTELEGIIPALESSHAVWATVKLAKTLGKDKDIVMCLSGRGDKDVEQISELLPKYAARLAMESVW